MPPRVIFTGDEYPWPPPTGPASVVFQMVAPVSAFRATTAAALPPLEPPGTRSRFQGLFVRPKIGLTAW